MKSFYVITAILVFVVLEGLFFLSVAEGATYYVNPSTGNDTNNGSSSEPWLTIERAYPSNTNDPHVDPGDTVMLADGEYGDFSLHNWTNDEWIYYKAQNEHGAVFDYLTMQNTTAINTYIDFNGVDFYRPNPDPLPDPNYCEDDGNYNAKGGNIVDIQNTNYVAIRNSNIHSESRYFNYLGIEMYGGQYLWVEDVNIHETFRGMLGNRNYVYAKRLNIHHICGSAFYATGGGEYYDMNQCLIHHWSDYEYASDDGEVYGIQQTLRDNDDTVSGTFTTGEKIMQSTTGAEGWVTRKGTSDGHLYLYYREVSSEDNFQSGYLVTGQASGATFTPTHINNPNYSPHGSGMAFYNGDNRYIGPIRNCIFRDGTATSGIQFYDDCAHHVAIENCAFVNAKFVDWGNESGEGAYGPIVIRNNQVISLPTYGHLNSWSSSIGDPPSPNTDWRTLIWYNSFAVDYADENYHHPLTETGDDLFYYGNITNYMQGFYPSGGYGYNFHYRGSKSNGSISAILDNGSGQCHGNPNMFEDIGYTVGNPYYDGVVDFWQDANSSSGFIPIPNDANDPNNAGVATIATYDEYFDGSVDYATQPPDSLGSIDEDGFITLGTVRDANHHSMGAYEISGLAASTPTPPASQSKYLLALP